MNRYSKMKCINCGKMGHSFRVCREPKTSYGIISIHIDNIEQNLKNIIINYLSSINNITDELTIPCENENALRKFSMYKEYIKLLLIMRKHTLGYMEFIKGRYSEIIPERIAPLFEQMTPDEMKKIENHSNDFDFLWNDVWTITNPIHNNQQPIVAETTNELSTLKHKSLNIKHHNMFKLQDYEFAKEKFKNFQCSSPINVNVLLKTVNPLFLYPEWGFPKGKRAGIESDIICAKREFEEETGYTDNDYVIFENIQPIVENIIGFNGVKYRYIYYIALLKSNKKPEKDIRMSQKYEIGDIGLFNYEDALIKIRPHHEDRRFIVRKICLNILRYLVTNC